MTTHTHTHTAKFAIHRYSSIFLGGFTTTELDELLDILFGDPYVRDVIWLHDETFVNRIVAWHRKTEAGWSSDFLAGALQRHDRVTLVIEKVPNTPEPGHAPHHDQDVNEPLEDDRVGYTSTVDHLGQFAILNIVSTEHPGATSTVNSEHPIMDMKSEVKPEDVMPHEGAPRVLDTRLPVQQTIPAAQPTEDLDEPVDDSHGECDCRACWSDAP